MTTVRLLTNIRRMRALKVYTLEASVTAVPCLANGVAKEASFKVSLFLSENNKDRTPYKAKIRYKRCNGQSCESAITSTSAVDFVNIDTGRAAGKVYERYIIEAFEVKDKKEVILSTLNVLTVRDGAQGQAGINGLIIPYGSWLADRTYRSTQEIKIFVERHKMYYVLIKLDTDCLGIDPATDTKNEWWRLMDYVEFTIVHAMVAEFGKIASAVFSGDFMLSQYGIDPDGQPIQTENGFEAFTPDMSKFIPNILLNFLTGYAHFAGGNVKFNGDGSVEIVGSISSSAGSTHIKLDAKTNSITMTSEGREVMTLSFEEMADSIGFRPSFKMIGPMNRLTGSLPTIHIRPTGVSLVLKGNRGYNLEFTLNGEGLTFKKEKLTAEGLVQSSKTTSYPAPENW